MHTAGGGSEGQSEGRGPRVRDRRTGAIEVERRWPWLFAQAPGAPSRGSGSGFGAGSGSGPGTGPVFGPGWRFGDGNGAGRNGFVRGLAAGLLRGARSLVGDVPVDPRALRRLAAELGIDLAEAAVPAAGYSTVAALLRRDLLAGQRPVAADLDALIAPADGRALVYPALDGATLPLFGRAIDLEALTRSPAAARQYAGGAALVVRVAPCDVHRIAFPAAGVALRTVGLAGAAVGPGVGAAGGRLLSRAFGDALLIEVALSTRGLASAAPPGPVEAGAPRASFGLGGGLAVVLIDRGRIAFDPDLVAASAAGVETRVRLGEQVGRRAATGSCGSASASDSAAR